MNTSLLVSRATARSTRNHISVGLGSAPKGEFDVSTPVRTRQLTASLRRTMSWDKLQDHATRTHKGVAYAGQDLRALQGYSDLFGYKKSQDGRIFAIPLRVVQPNLYTLQLVEDMEKCQEYTPGPEDLWLIKENPNIPFPLAYTQIRAVFDAPAPVQAQALAQTAYQNSATYSMVSAPAGAPQMSSEWRQATGIGASSTPDQMQVPGLATTADSTALPPAVNYMMTSYNTASPYAQLPQHPDISAYIERPDGGRMAPHSTVPISANIGPSLELPPSQVMPMQQQLPMANFASMAYNYCQPGQFQPILEEQTGHAEFHDHRRSSGSSAGTYYSEGDDVSGMDFESSAHNQSYAGPAHQYASNMPACVQPSEPYEDFERSTGDGSHSPVPDLTSSEAQSPAEEDADNMTLEGDDMAIKLEIDHTNGQLLPSQVHNIY